MLASPYVRWEGRALNFQYNDPNSNPRYWVEAKNAYNENDRWLTLQLFNEDDDPDKKGVPSDPNDPKGQILYPDYGHEGIPGFADETYQFMAGL